MAHDLVICFQGIVAEAFTQVAVQIYLVHMVPPCFCFQMKIQKGKDILSGYIPKDVFAFAAYSIDLYPKIVNGICDISNDSVAHSKSRGLTYTYFYKNPKTFQLESVDPSGLFILLGKCLHNKCCH